MALLLPQRPVEVAYMSRLSHIAVVSGTLFLLPLVGCASAGQFGRSSGQAGYSSGYQSGERAGFDDARKGDRFQFTDESDYRNFSRSRPRDSNEARFREDFLRGFEAGYRTGYEGVRERRNQSGTPSWSNGGGYARGRTVYDLPSDYGFRDGYEAGVNDARDRHRFDPLGESRYKSGDHGYERTYGSRDEYRARYRTSFREGYEQGFYGRYR